jgi:MFS transporter, FHS family, glucose/mannose:H+ symporter
MPASDKPKASASAKPLTLAAYGSFVPIGVATVLLGPMLPTLSARWALNYSQAGALFTAQYSASTCAVAASGVLVARRGFRFAIKVGLILMASGVGVLTAGPKWVGIGCLVIYGAGIGLAVPAANLLVAEVNPARRSAALNLLNFCWSVGAVACPFLVAAVAKRQHISWLLTAVTGLALLIALGIAVMPRWIIEPPAGKDDRGKRAPLEWRIKALPVLGVLFFIYVGTENAFGGWVATYSKNLGTLTATMALMSPSFFYGAIMVGRWLAPMVLRTVEDVRLVQSGLLIACAGMTGLVLAHSLAGVGASACLAGFGLSTVYPITISMLSREFGVSATRVGSLMFTLANLGGGILPWMVGISSSQFGTLKAGLAVPLVGSALMWVLYLREWAVAPAEQLV